MAGYSSLAAAITQIAGSGRGSHRRARVLRFIFRNPRKHRTIIKHMIKSQRAHERQCDAEFRAMQLRALRPLTRDERVEEVKQLALRQLRRQGKIA